MQGRARDFDHRAPLLNSSMGEGGQRTFVIVCPADRVRTNIETYVRDHDTGRVAAQWSLASKETGKGRLNHDRKWKRGAPRNAIEADPFRKLCGVRHYRHKLAHCLA